MVYVCNMCEKKFNTLFNLSRHTNAKMPCNKIAKRQQFEEDHSCECGKIFKRNDRYIKHRETCKSKTDRLEKIIVGLSEQMEKQNEKIDQLIKKDSNVVNVSNVTNQTQNIYGLNAFGKENLDYLTDQEYNKIFKKGCRAIQDFVKMIHCNDNAPENRNIYIGNFKDKYIRTFNGNMWVIENKDDVLHNLFNSKRDLLEYKYNDMEESLGKEAKYFFGKKYFENCTNEKAIKDIKDDIRNMLYDNRLCVIKKPNKKIKKTNEILNARDTIEDFSSCDYIPNKPMFF